MLYVIKGLKVTNPERVLQWCTYTMLHKGSTQKDAEALTRHVGFCFKVVVLEVTSVVAEVNYSKERFSIAFFFHQLAVDDILHFYGRLKNIASL